MNFYKNLFKDYVKSFFFDSTEKKNDYDFAYSNKQIKFASSQLWKLELLYLFKIIKIKKPSLGLDFGCNEGTGTEKISTITNSKMFGVDSSEIAIEKAKKKKIKNITFLITNKNRLPFKNNYFDFVTMIHVIGHLIEPSKVLDELLRVLKPDGVIYITTPNYNYKILSILDSLINNYKPDMTVRKYYSKNEIINLINKKYIDSIKYDYFGDKPKLVKFLKQTKIFNNRLMVCIKKKNEKIK